MMIQYEGNPLIEDIKEEYVKHRKMGRTRAEAIEIIRDEYAEELEDIDDRPAILAGLCLGLCKKKELFEAIAAETLDEIQRVNRENAKEMINDISLKKVERCLRNKAMYGKEAIYRRPSIYVPDWNIGDTFSHVLTYPTSEKLGIKGWNILLYKVDEYVDRFEEHRQLMYVSLCPPDQIPTCGKDLEKLGFLRMMCRGDKAEYLAQITIKSKKAEKAYELTKVGCFPDVLFPDDRVEENPLTTMPLFGHLRRDDLWPAYEDQICRIYRRNGRRGEISI